MTTKREGILAAVATVIGGISGATIFRSRVSPFLASEGIGILLTWVRDVPQQTMMGSGPTTWALQFRVSVIARSATPDTTADATVKSIYGALMTSSTLRALVLDLAPAPHELQLADADGGGAVVSMDFLAEYRTSLTDLST